MKHMGSHKQTKYVDVGYFECECWVPVPVRFLIFVCSRFQGFRLLFSVRFPSSDSGIAILCLNSEDINVRLKRQRIVLGI